MGSKYTENQWVEIKQGFVNNNVELISEYTGGNENHVFKCLNIECGNIFLAQFYRMKLGRSRCQNCNSIYRKGVCLSESKYQEFQKVALDKGVKILGPSVKMSDKVPCVCLKCDNNWSPTLSNIIQSKKGCFNCYKTKQVDSKNVKIAELKNRLIEMLDPTVSSMSKTNFKCLNYSCNHVWMATLSNVYHKKTGCPRCGIPYKLTNADVLHRIELVGQLNIKMLDNYVDAAKYNKFKCLELNCGHTWTSTLAKVSRGSSCTKCKLKRFMKM